MPVIDRVAAEYAPAVRFIAVAGRSDLSRTSAAAAELFDHLDWGLDDAIWDLYGIPGQPASVLITGDDVIVDGWFGGRAEAELRAALDRLVALGS